MKSMFIFCFILSLSTTGLNFAAELRPIPKPPSIANVSHALVSSHVQSFLQISESADKYEETRAKAREYIVLSLTSATGSGSPFSGEQVLYHKFDWTDTAVDPEAASSDKPITTKWSGVNILAWTNTSTLKRGTKFAVVAARYDSLGWWSETSHKNTYACTSSSPHRDMRRLCSRTQPQSTSSRVAAYGLANDMTGAGALLQLARAVLGFQKNLKQTLDSLSAFDMLKYFDKKDPGSIETGIYEDVPILFVFFDHESVGSLGSQVWSEYYGIGKLVKDETIESLTALDFAQSWKPHDPLLDRAQTGTPTSWKILAPNFTISPEWLTSLLMPPSEKAVLRTIRKKIKDDL
eukprot:TRINITY_DN9163_c0_g1_i1.p1 TRINITY_DN9163_c0_g1~~TRINITY_DN9163_c0_g1_i1.p1  ORF type:complete len:349 (+),score=42.58 TRINITY_DN9163_c0_g1_i1:26-1072(+)